MPLIKYTMKNINSLKLYTIIGTIFVLIVGTISHFVYDWSQQNHILGLFFPTNESTWEHMKLIFFPMLLYALFMNRRQKTEYPWVTCALLSGILLGTFLIPVFFYSYSGILGNHYLALDIAVFAAAVICAFLAVYRLTLSCQCHSGTQALKLLVFAVAFCFLWFTYHAPALGIFIDPTQ